MATRRAWRSRSYGAGGASPPPARADFASRLGPCFEDEVERRLGGSPEVREPGLLEDVTEPSLTGLGTEAETDLLRERVGRADRRRRGVKQGGHRVVG